MQGTAAVSQGFLIAVSALYMCNHQEDNQSRKVRDAVMSDGEGLEAYSWRN